jgi:uncharacterized protein YcbK (DUF882 family)
MIHPHEPTIPEECALIGEKWLLDPRLAQRVAVVMHEWRKETHIGIEVISGYRTVEEQRELIRRGRPAADPSVSTHTSCPSTGVDVRINGLMTRLMKARFLRIARMAGLRVGGNDYCTPSTCDDIGIPNDWNHLDLGRRGTNPLPWPEAKPQGDW